jgi:hypothetical protein
MTTAPFNIIERERKGVHAAPGFSKPAWKRYATLGGVSKLWAAFMVLKAMQLRSSPELATPVLPNRADPTSGCCFDDRVRVLRNAT